MKLNQFPFFVEFSNHSFERAVRNNYLNFDDFLDYRFVWLVFYNNFIILYPSNEQYLQWIVIGIFILFHYNGAKIGNGGMIESQINANGFWYFKGNMYISYI